MAFAHAASEPLRLVEIAHHFLIPSIFLTRRAWLLS
jgi:hypothetical protein